MTNYIYISVHPQRSQNKANNVAMAWTDYKKANDMVLQTRMCLKMFKISDKIINFITKAMESWMVELTAGE